MRLPTLLPTALFLPALLNCSGGEPECQTREDARGGRWILECVSDQPSDTVQLVGSYFDPAWTADLPSGANVYCSDRGPTFAWFPGVRLAERSGRWLDKTVIQRLDGGGSTRSRWLMSADDDGRPLYYLFGERAIAFVERVRDGEELLLETVVDYDAEPAIRLIFLEGLGGVVDRLPCFRD